jgi:hypothetical protein
MRLSNDAIPPRAKASWLPCYGSVTMSVILYCLVSDMFSPPMILRLFLPLANHTPLVASQIESKA